MRVSLFFAMIFALFFMPGTVSAQTIAIDKSFRSHGEPGVKINETGEIGYEFVYVYKLVEMRGKLGLCGAVIANYWDKRYRKAVGVTVAKLGGAQLKRGLNYMPNYEGGRREFRDPRLAFIGRRYIWSLDPAIALGKTARCKRMRPAWTDAMAAAKVEFVLPERVFIYESR